jgi:hypothetical protein
MWVRDELHWILVSAGIAVTTRLVLVAFVLAYLSISPSFSSGSAPKLVAISKNKRSSIL